MQSGQSVALSPQIHDRWSDRYATGLVAMDEEHREFIDTAFDLKDCNVDDIAKCLGAMQEHCRQHFAEEARLMVRFDYPVRDCHVAEHEAVLASVVQVDALWVENRDEATVRRLAAQLIDWFGLHVQYLDSAVAAWVVKKQTGGVPVVLRRDVGPAGAPAIFLDLAVPTAARGGPCAEITSKDIEHVDP